MARWEGGRGQLSSRDRFARSLASLKISYLSYLESLREAGRSGVRPGVETLYFNYAFADRLHYNLHRYANAPFFHSLIPSCRTLSTVLMGGLLNAFLGGHYVSELPKVYRKVAEPLIVGRFLITYVILSTDERVGLRSIYSEEIAQYQALLYNMSRHPPYIKYMLTKDGLRRVESTYDALTSAIFRERLLKDLELSSPTVVDAGRASDVVGYVKGRAREFEELRVRHLRGELSDEDLKRFTHLVYLFSDYALQGFEGLKPLSYSSIEGAGNPYLAYTLYYIVQSACNSVISWGSSALNPRNYRLVQEAVTAKGVVLAGYSLADVVFKEVWSMLEGLKGGEDLASLELPDVLKEGNMLREWEGRFRELISRLKLRGEEREELKGMVPRVRSKLSIQHDLGGIEQRVSVAELVGTMVSIITGEFRTYSKLLTTTDLGGFIKRRYRVSDYALGLIRRYGKGLVSSWGTLYKDIKLDEREVISYYRGIEGLT